MPLSKLSLELLINGYIREYEQDLDLFMNIPNGIAQEKQNIVQKGVHVLRAILYYCKIAKIKPWKLFFVNLPQSKLTQCITLIENNRILKDKS